MAEEQKDKKLKMHSPDLTEANIEKLAELFPNCVTEAKDEAGNLKRAIDFDQLRQELSDNVVDGPRERYQLIWPGKREALLASNAPIAKTLRPCREESVDFDTTKNLFIEGDNLDALKLLQETYLGRVKLIYIDPPYNRKKGNNLVYRDDFVGNTYEYLTQSNQADEQGYRLVANTEANGRFHSDWLGMMYQRLRVARNLLSSAGVVAISIDDAETANVLHLCYEVFGESNFVGTIIWKNATDNNPSNIAVEHESIHVFARSKSDLEGVWKSSVSDIKDVLVKIGSELTERYSDQDELQSAYTKWYRENKAQLGPLADYKFIDKKGVYAGSRSVHNPGKEGYRYDVIHPETGKPCTQPLMGYRFPEESMKRLLEERRVLFGEDETKLIELKVYAAEFEDKLSSVFDLDGRSGPYDLKTLFPEGKKVFSNPKPVLLMERLVSFMTGPQDICLDLFAGSSTLAHAMLESNRREGANRRCVSIQYPEAIGQDSKDAKEAFQFCMQMGLEPLISEISKARIRRAGSAVLQQERGVPEWNRDVGFRVLKIDSSNMKEVYYAPDAIAQEDLLGQVDNIKEDRTDEDLLFQVLLDWGVDLSLPIKADIIAGKQVYFVDENALAACFETGIDEDFVKALSEHKPLRAVFRDGGYGNDSTKINVEQIFKLISPTTEVKTI